MIGRSSDADPPGRYNPDLPLENAPHAAALLYENSGAGIDVYRAFPEDDIGGNRLRIRSGSGDVSVPSGVSTLADGWFLFVDGFGFRCDCDAGGGGSMLSRESRSFSVAAVFGGSPDRGTLLTWASRTERIASEERRNELVGNGCADVFLVLRNGVLKPVLPSRFEPGCGDVFVAAFGVDFSQKSAERCPPLACVFVDNDSGALVEGECIASSGSWYEPKPYVHPLRDGEQVCIVLPGTGAFTVSAAGY